MNGFIFAFLAVGAVFGWLSFDQRHHFSEGSTKPDAAGPHRQRQRAGWVLLCTALWPLMMVSGAFGWWQRRVRTSAAVSRRTDD
jgi:hypothetical protein